MCYFLCKITKYHAHRAQNMLKVLIELYGVYSIYSNVT